MRDMGHKDFDYKGSKAHKPFKHGKGMDLLAWRRESNDSGLNIWQHSLRNDNFDDEFHDQSFASKLNKVRS